LAAVPAMTQHRLALALCGIVYPAVVIAQHDPENYVYTSHSFQHPYVLHPHILSVIFPAISSSPRMVPHSHCGWSSHVSARRCAAVQLWPCSQLLLTCCFPAMARSAKLCHRTCFVCALATIQSVPQHVCHVHLRRWLPTRTGAVPDSPISVARPPFSWQVH
jgi:hypothetical protein